MRFTVFARRIHKYLALFLTPWLLVYGLSAAVMNHMPFFRGLYGQAWQQYTREAETTYTGQLPEGADAKAVAPLILKDLGLDGAHWVDAPREGSRITINRMRLISPRRITFTPADRKVVIERQAFQLPSFLRQTHVRRGYEQPYLADTVWAVGVDVTIVAMLTWAMTGLWMWYKMKTTRRWGLILVVAGCTLFAVFLVTI